MLLVLLSPFLFYHYHRSSSSFFFSSSTCSSSSSRLLHVKQRRVTTISVELREARLDHVHNYLFIAKKDRTFLLSIFDVDLYRVLGNNIYSFVENQIARRTIFRRFGIYWCPPCFGFAYLTRSSSHKEKSRASKLPRSSTGLQIFRSLGRQVQPGRSIIHETHGRGTILFRK